MKHVTVWMNEKGINVDALETATGLNRQLLEAIAQGRYLTSPQQREKIAAALGLKPEEITWGHANPIDHMYGF